MAANPNLSQAEHARYLGISENTLKQHLRLIYRALEVTNLTAAVMKAMQLGIISLASVAPLVNMAQGPLSSRPGEDAERSVNDRVKGE